MEKYNQIKNSWPDKSDAQIIEMLAYEVKDKVETIHRLLSEIDALKHKPFYCYVSDVSDSAPCDKQCEECRNSGLSG